MHTFVLCVQLHQSGELAQSDDLPVGDHMAVLGAVGILPMNQLIHAGYMKNTLHWICVG